jgi:hypothetical protein
MLTLPTANMEQTTEGTNLHIRTLGLRDLGPYTCQVITAASNQGDQMKKGPGRNFEPGLPCD